MKDESRQGEPGRVSAGSLLSASFILHPSVAGRSSPPGGQSPHPRPGPGSAAMARLVLAALLCLRACAGRPRAPDLDEGSAFQSARERLSFTLPDGWSQQARAEPPAGRIDRERLLVLYRRSAPRATFAVTLIDLAEDADLEAYVKKQLADGLPWRLRPPAESCHVGSRRGRRCVLAAEG